MSRKAVQLFILMFLAVFVSLSEAAVWESIPDFPQARREKQEDMLIDNKPVHNIIYSCDSPIGQILEFYKTKMTNFGWSLERETIQDQMGMFIFVKGAISANIVVQTIMGRNFITVVQSQTSGILDSKPCAECDQDAAAKLVKQLESVPEGVDPKTQLRLEPEPGSAGIPERDAPGKDLQSVPRYPASTRVSNSERYNGKEVNLTYFSRDTVEKAENFYRTNMVAYNWVLEKEADFQDAPKALSEKTNVNLKGKSLVFKNRSASCIINVFEEPQGKGTVIGVNYNEK